MSPLPQAPAPVAAPAVRGGLLMSLAMLCFVLNDTVAKSLGGTMNAGQFIAVRGAFASIIIALLVVAVAAGQRATRNLAKRQLTWLRSETGFQPVRGLEDQELAPILGAMRATAGRP